MSSATWPTTLDGMNELSWEEFEKFVADIYSARGYETDWIQLTSDRSRDVVADKNGNRTVIQAKQYSQSNRLGPGEVQKYSGLLHEDDVDRVALVITSTLTGKGWETANRIKDMDIVTGDRLVDWATKYEPHRKDTTTHESRTINSQRAVGIGEVLGEAYRSYLGFGARIFAIPLKFTLWYFKAIFRAIKAVFSRSNGSD